MADGTAGQSRNHIRLRQIADATNGPTTVGTPHYEIVFLECGHAVYPTQNGVSGYEMATQRLYDTMRGSHVSRHEYWGNTQAFWQRCGGWWAQGNGWVRAFSVAN